MEERQPTPRLQAFPQLSRGAFFSAQNQGLVADYLAHSTCPPLCARDAGSDYPCAQKLRSLDARRAADHALSGPGPDHPR